MTQLVAAIQSTALLSLLLWTKVAATNLGLGGAKMNAGRRAPEDTYQKPEAEVSEDAKVANDRAQRVVNNDLENIPYTMALAWGSLFCLSLVSDTTKQDGHAIAHIALYTTFCVMRIAHSIVYLKGIAILRSLVWFVAFLCTFGIALNGAIAAFQIDNM
jgi:uncharacterized MAPEG superfamily protein